MNRIGYTTQCKNKPTFMVFGWDGNPHLSRLDSVCCDEHLAEAVRQATAENKKCAAREKAKRIERAKKNVEAEEAEERKLNRFRTFRKEIEED